MDSPYDIMKGSFWTFIQFIPTFNWESDKKPSPKRNHVWSLQFDPSPYPPYPVPTWPPQVGWNAPIHEGCLESGVPQHSLNGIPGSDWLEVPTIYKAYFQGYVREYPHKIWPYMVQYLHVRILKFPLILCLNWPVAGRPLSQRPIWTPTTKNCWFPIFCTAVYPMKYLHIPHVHHIISRYKLNHHLVGYTTWCYMYIVQGYWWTIGFRIIVQCPNYISMMVGLIPTFFVMYIYIVTYYDIIYVYIILFLWNKMLILDVLWLFSWLVNIPIDGKIFKY